MLSTEKSRIINLLLRSLRSFGNGLEFYTNQPKPPAKIKKFLIPHFLLNNLLRSFFKLSSDSLSVPSNLQSIPAAKNNNEE